MESLWKVNCAAAQIFSTLALLLNFFILCSFCNERTAYCANFILLLLPSQPISPARIH